MPSFVDSLRMNNIYPSGGGTFGPPIDASPNFDAIARIMNLAMGPAIQNRNAEWQREDNLRAQDRSQRLQDIARSMASNIMEPTQPQNVQMAPSAISPLDIAKLNLEKQKLGEKQTTDIANIGIKQKQTDIKSSQEGVSQQRANIYQFKATHPNMKIVSDKGGNFYAVDPITGKSMDTGISTGTVSDEEKLNITGGQRLDEITARGKTQQANIAARTKGEEDVAAARGAEARQTKQSPTAQPTLPSQINRDQMNKARQIKNTDSELGPFVNIDQGGNFTITPPAEGIFGHSGPTSDQYHRINNAIYGSQDTTDTTTLTKPKSKYAVTVTPAPTTDTTPDSTTDSTPDSSDSTSQ